MNVYICVERDWKSAYEKMKEAYDTKTQLLEEYEHSNL